MNTLEDNRHTRAWRALGEQQPRPKAILCVSAHWVTRGTAVTAMSKPRTIHDFGGFPQALFDVQYPAPGSPELARRVGEILSPVSVVQDTQQWGLDHGTWSVLAHVYPKADVPVVQLSLDGTLDDAGHYLLAKHLNALRDEGVMIVASGNVVHNLGRIQWQGHAAAHAWGARFNDWAREKIVQGEHGPLISWQKLQGEQGQDARLSIPTPEHYWPMHYVLAQQQPGEKVSLITDGVEMGSISMLSFSIS